MSDVQHYRGNEFLPRDARRASRSMSRYQAAGQVRTTQIDVDTDVAMAKMDAVTAAFGQGSAAIIKVAKLHEQLELVSPAASGRLAFLADSHMIAVDDSLTDLRRELRRR